ncbi:FAD:protein FMN transferase [Sedimentibacter sp. zth1]|uniref:FAD:protein FMN transferase n=1 Tax=Sedimentibacter sp. zth1 TaxID=2816908 RepID=UPI001F5F0B58|nr:FAD:protein FMN transferase [Sedimentibacter sp. zth1]
MRNILIKSLIVLILLTLFTGCNNSKISRYQAEFLNLFDTVTTIIGYARDENEFKEYSQFIHDELEIYHKLYDIYNDYEGINNIKTINKKAGIEPVKVDKKIIDLLVLGKNLYNDTDGNVNIVFGSVLSIWHDFREDGINNPESAKIPDIDVLKEASKHVDINNLIIDELNSTVYLKDSKMQIDVGAIAKGFATQRVADDVYKKGFVSGALSVGGNICTIGIKADNEPWKIGIQNPDMSSEQKNIKLVSLENKSLVSSGNYQRYYVAGGIKYHHIINKDTLMPSNYYKSVSILCDDSGLADAYSTAAYNMPLEDSMKFISELENVEALWILNDGEIKYSENFENYLAE